MTTGGAKVSQHYVNVQLDRVAHEPPEEELRYYQVWQL